MRMTYRYVLVVALAAACALPAVLSAATISVPGDQPTIEAGVNAAAPGDTVVVACGVYYEHDIAVGVDICLRSETGERDCVVIDAQQQGRVFSLHGLSAASEVVGFTVTNGVADEQCGGGAYCEQSSPMMRNLLFLSNAAHGEGGGLFCDHSSPVLIDVAFVDNSALGYYTGGGMYCRWSSPTLIRVDFAHNTATRNGGGLYCIQSSPALEDVAFDGNTADVHGGGMYCATAPAVLERVVFSDNSAGGHGGGLFCVHSSGSIVDALFSHNAAGNRGGGLYCSDSSLDVQSTTFWSNVSETCGGAVSCGDLSSPVLVSVTMAANSAVEEGGGIFCADSSPHLDGVIVAFSASGGGVFGEGVSDPLLTCCDAWGNVGGDYGGSVANPTSMNGNISEDPLFCDLGGGDLTVSASSSCVPENNSCGLQIGAHGIGCGIVPVRTMSFGAIKAMFRHGSCPSN